MSKKSFRIIGIICAVCIIFLIACIIVLPLINNYVEYCKNKKKVLDYMESHYDIGYQLVNTKVGENAWPAGRTEDVFYFKDVTNDMFFIVDCVDGYIHDYYSRHFEGKKVSDVIIKEFPQAEKKYYIRCNGEKNQSKEKPYQSMWCQLFFLTENKDDLSYAYEITSYMKDNFPGLELHLMIVPYSVENNIINLFEYKKIIALNDMECFYNIQWELKSTLFSTEEEFRQLLEKE